MTVANQTNKVTGTGNDVATVFSFSPMVIFASSELVVTHRTAAGVETVIAEGVGATNWAIVEPITFPATGSITYPADTVTPLPTGETITIKRVLVLEQQTNLENRGGYLPETQEDQYDRFVMIDLQQQEEIDRMLRFGVSYTGSIPADIGTPIASSYLRVNDAGTALEWATISVADASASNATPIDVSLSAAATGSAADFSREDHIHLLPTVSIAKGGTGATTAAAALAALGAVGLGDANAWTGINTYSKQMQWSKGADVTAANPCVLGTDGNYFDIIGNTNFASFTVAAGTFFMVQFDGTPTLTHHATNLNLPGAADRIVVAGDRMICYAPSANSVHVLAYAKVDGTPLLKTITGIGLPDFVSTLQTMTADTVLDVAHGLSALPNMVLVTMVENDAGGDIGYAQNEEVIFMGGHVTDANFSVQFDATNVTIVQSLTLPRLIDPSTFNSATGTITDWRIKVRAWL